MKKVIYEAVVTKVNTEGCIFQVGDRLNVTRVEWRSQRITFEGVTIHHKGLGHNFHIYAALTEGAHGCDFKLCPKEIEEEIEEEIKEESVKNITILHEADDLHGKTIHKVFRMTVDEWLILTEDDCMLKIVALPYYDNTTQLRTSSDITNADFMYAGLMGREEYECAAQAEYVKRQEQKEERDRGVYERLKRKYGGE